MLISLNLQARPHEESRPPLRVQGYVLAQHRPYAVQGYISPVARDVLGVRVHYPALSALSGPGGTFDAASPVASLCPVGRTGLLIRPPHTGVASSRAALSRGRLPARQVVLHGLAIFGLNRAFTSVAAALTRSENHRTQRAFDTSLAAKRFAFEAFA